MIRTFAFVTMLGLFATSAGAQTGPLPPVIDMHVHSTNTSPQVVQGRMDNRNLRFFFLSALVSDLSSWRAAFEPARYLPGIVFPCEDGRAPITGRSCFDTTEPFPDVA